MGLVGPLAFVGGVERFVPFEDDEVGKGVGCLGGKEEVCVVV